MNTKNAAYGTVYNNGSTWSASFWNPIKQDRDYLGTGATEPEARKILNSYVFDFYSKHSWLLPKRISLDRRARQFKFTLPRGLKTMYFGQYDTLEEAVAAKAELINKII